MLALLGAWVLAGLALIAVGSWLATRGARARRPEAQGLATSWPWDQSAKYAERR